MNRVCVIRVVTMDTYLYCAPKAKDMPRYSTANPPSIVNWWPQEGDLVACDDATASYGHVTAVPMPTAAAAAAIKANPAQKDMFAFLASINYSPLVVKSRNMGASVKRCVVELPNTLAKIDRSVFKRGNYRIMDPVMLIFDNHDAPAQNTGTGFRLVRIPQTLDEFVATFGSTIDRANYGADAATRVNYMLALLRFFDGVHVEAPRNMHVDNWITVMWQYVLKYMQSRMQLGAVQEYVSVPEKLVNPDVPRVTVLLTKGG